MIINKGTFTKPLEQFADGEVFTFPSHSKLEYFIKSNYKKVNNITDVYYIGVTNLETGHFMFLDAKIKVKSANVIIKTEAE